MLSIKTSLYNFALSISACTPVSHEILSFPVTNEDWVRLGKIAGHLRNKRMLDEGKPDVVIAFLDTDNASPGTHNMMAQAEAYGVRVIVIRKSCTSRSQEGKSSSDAGGNSSAG
jgi:hypothetical protein